MEPKTIFIISDGTGETASMMTKAALVQFPQHDVNIIRQKNTRSEEQLISITERAMKSQAMIVHTIVSPKLRKTLLEESEKRNVIAIDLLGDLLYSLSQFFGGTLSSLQAGRLRNIDADYFNRTEAIEYTVRHDDGKTFNQLNEADIILVGISRTSKTPLSIFLSHKGLKVANIPLVLDVPLPEELTQVDQRKIVGLTIDINSLSRIRKKRLEKFQQDPGGSYASLDHISREIEFAMKIFKQNKRWPVFDVTDRALEETASEIVKTVSSRMTWSKNKYLLF